MSVESDRVDASAQAEASPSRAGGNRPRLVAYAALGLGSLGLFFQALSLPASRWEPLGAGTFPAIILGLLIALCALGAVTEAMARRETGPGIVASITSHRLAIVTFVAFAAYIVLLPVLGFGLATFGFLLVAQIWLAPATWTARAVSLVLAITFSFGLEWLFAEAFNIFLPRASLFN